MSSLTRTLAVLWIVGWGAVLVYTFHEAYLIFTH